MKKSSIHIVLLAFAAFSFSVFNIFSTTKTTAILAVEKPLIVFDKNSNSPDVEIEYCTGFVHSFIQVQQNFLKGNADINPYKEPIVSLSTATSTNNFAYVELYSNNYLEHNYPSHNFW